MRIQAQTTVVIECVAIFPNINPMGGKKKGKKSAGICYIYVFAISIGELTFFRNV